MVSVWVQLRAVAKQNAYDGESRQMAMVAPFVPYFELELELLLLFEIEKSCYLEYNSALIHITI